MQHIAPDPRQLTIELGDLFHTGVLTVDSALPNLVRGSIPRGWEVSNKREVVIHLAKSFLERPGLNCEYYARAVLHAIKTLESMGALHPGQYGLQKASAQMHELASDMVECIAETHRDHHPALKALCDHHREEASTPYESYLWDAIKYSLSDEEDLDHDSETEDNGNVVHEGAHHVDQEVHMVEDDHE